MQVAVAADQTIIAEAAQALLLEDLLEQAVVVLVGQTEMELQDLLAQAAAEAAVH
jgi:hypothetical protein